MTHRLEQLEQFLVEFKTPLMKPDDKICEMIEILVRGDPKAAFHKRDEFLDMEWDGLSPEDTQKLAEKQALLADMVLSRDKKRIVQNLLMALDSNFIPDFARKRSSNSVKSLV